LKFLICLLASQETNSPASANFELCLMLKQRFTSCDRRRLMSASQEINMEAYLDASSINGVFDDPEDEKYLTDGEIDIDESMSLEGDIDDAIDPDDIDTREKPAPVSSAGLHAGPHAHDNQEILFRELMRDHQKRLYRFVIRYIDHPDDAADITQQAFVEAARTISSFRGDSKLSTWLYGIAMNMVRNYMRKLIEQDLYELPVLSYQELTPEVNIQPLARVEI
jgi:Sigma-70 region 2